MQLNEFTMISRTQPSGPLCFWQCLLYIWLYVLSFESTGGLLVARSERPPVGDCKGFLKQKDNLDKVAERFKQ